MNTKLVARISQALIILIFVLGVVWTPNTNARADWPFPVFMLEIHNDSSWQGLHAWSWPLGSQVTLTVDDPGTPQSPDYTEVQTMGSGSGSQTSHAMYLHNHEFDGHPGFTITLSDGIQTKTMTVPLLTVTGYDLANDTIIGVSDPFARIQVPVSPAVGDYYVEPIVNADSEGNWLVDLRASDFTFDLKPGDVAEAQIYDADWDHIVMRDWSVPPIIDTRFHENEVYGYGWWLNTEITMTIDDPDTLQPIDYTDTQTIAISESDPPQTFVQFRLWENNFELENGQIITMSDGTTTKTHVVAVPTITNVDTRAAIVEGSAASFAEVWLHLNIWDEPRFAGDVTRHEIADATGHWYANFLLPGDEDFETGTTYIDEDHEGEVRVQDEDGDSTSTNWGRGLLMLELNSDGGPRDLYIRHWPGRSQLSITIDDPTTWQNPDYTDTQMIYWSDERSISQVTYYWNEAFDVRPGFTITVSDGYITKTMVVPLLTVMGYDLANDTISGDSDPFATIRVPVSHAIGPEWVEPTVTADSEGHWVANLAIPSYPDNEIYDLLLGDFAEPQTYEADGDHTVLRDWSIPTWTLKGFYQPVDMNGVYNVVKGGSTVPIKFEIFSGSTELTDTIHITGITYIQTACEVGAMIDEIETTTIGLTSLRYDITSGQFIYNWKTPKTAGVCYCLTLTTDDGSTLVAYFKLK